MGENESREKGQSLVIVAFAVIVLLVFAVIAVDLAYGYVHRRGDQNAADAASLAGARELAQLRNDQRNGLISPGAFVTPQAIEAAMNTFAERNGIEDSDGEAGNYVNTNVVGYYLDASGERLQQSGQDIVISQLDFVPPAALGIEAVVQSVAPSFFGGVMGLSGLPIQAEAAAVLQGACEMGCLAPIATLTTTFEYTPTCYNIWDGSRQARTISPDYTCSNDETISCTQHNECNFHQCLEGGTCRDNSNVTCTTNSDCDGVCVGIQDHCSNVVLTPCVRDSQCNFGSCVDNACSQAPNPFCATDADCSGTCGNVDSYFGSECFNNDGTPAQPITACEVDADCGAGQYCDEMDGSSGSSSGLGWLNWSLGGEDNSCQSVGEGSDCSASCLDYNLVPETCLSGLIQAGEWVAGAAGLKTSARPFLDYYIQNDLPMTVILYDIFDGQGCNQGGAAPGKLRYHVAGFAEFEIMGYQLAQGGGNAYCRDGFDCDACIDWGPEEGNRITGVFLGTVDGMPGNCGAGGTIITARVIK